MRGLFRHFQGPALGLISSAATGRADRVNITIAAIAYFGLDK